MAERTAADAALAHEPLVKQEPSHAALGEPCTNVYDALFDVVKHEVSDAACGEVSAIGLRHTRSGGIIS